MREDARYLAERKNARDWRLRAPYEWLEYMRDGMDPEGSLPEFSRGLEAFVASVRLAEALEDFAEGRSIDRKALEHGLSEYHAALLGRFFAAASDGTISMKGLRSLQHEILVEASSFFEEAGERASLLFSECARECIRKVERCDRDERDARSIGDREHISQEIGYAAKDFSTQVSALRAAGLLDEHQEVLSAELLGRCRRRAEAFKAVDEPFFEEERQRIRSGTLRGASFREHMIQHRRDDAYWCRLFGWSKELPKDGRADPDMVHYQPTDPETFLRALDRLDLRPGEVFYDIGCGRGGLVMMAELVTGAKAKGVEFQSTLAEQARAAVHLLGLKAEIVNADIRDADVSDGDVFYFFNPFGGEILRSVLEKLRRIAETKPIRFCWYGPQERLVKGLVSGWARSVGDGWFTVFESLPPRP